MGAVAGLAVMAAETLLAVMTTLFICAMAGAVAMAIWSFGREARLRRQTDQMHQQALDQTRLSQEVIRTLQEIAKAIDSGSTMTRDAREAVLRSIERLELQLQMHLRGGVSFHVGDDIRAQHVDGDAGKIDRRGT